MNIVQISQIDRSFDTAGLPMPSLEHVRLPNPLDLSLFDKAWFINDWQMRVS